MIGGVFAAALFGVAGVANAQPPVEELTVVGHYGPRGEVQSLSQVVNIDDLNLSVRADRNELGRRIDMAARDVCRRLGEPFHATGPSCERDAVASTRPQIRLAMAQARNRGAYGLAYAAPPPPDYAPAAYAPAAGTYGSEASVTVQTVTNGPVPDTAANRARFGGPMSRAGRHTSAAGN